MGFYKMPRSFPDTGKGELEFVGVENGVSLSPTQNTKYKVEDEEGPKDDQAYEVHPGQLIPHGILHLGREGTCWLEHANIPSELEVRKGRCSFQVGCPLCTSPSKAHRSSLPW